MGESSGSVLRIKPLGWNRTQTLSAALKVEYCKMVTSKEVMAANVPRAGTDHSESFLSLSGYFHYRSQDYQVLSHLDTVWLFLKYLSIPS